MFLDTRLVQECKSKCTQRDILLGKLNWLFKIILKNQAIYYEMNERGTMPLKCNTFDYIYL